MRAAIILAAGKGTRLRSQLPKVLHQVGGRPMVLSAVDLARQANLSPIVVVVGHGADQVQATLDAERPGLCRYALQTEQKGTGHAVRVGLGALGDGPGHVLILSGDVPLLNPATVENLVRDGVWTRFLTTRLDEPHGYGRVVRDLEGAPVRIVEQKDASESERAIREVNAGTYWFNLEFLRKAVAELDSDNAQGELYLTDVVEAAARHGQAQAVTVENPVEVMGINTRRELAQVEAHLYAQIAEYHMSQGVTIRDPASTRIDADVHIGPDSVLEPRVTLRRDTRVGRGCHIDVGSVLTDATVGDGVTIHPYSVVEEAQVGDGASVGPFARLRTGTVMMAGSKVGNFVELKKTRLGAGAKANHLSYLGDSVVGDEANVGAGTITCNYDGYGKYLTEIGDRTFVGSNATLVAPLRIGADAYVAAGSTLTEEVPADGLAFGRARQTNKPERARHIRERARSRAAGASEKKG